MDSSSGQPQDTEAIEQSVKSAVPDADGPVQVLDSTDSPDGGAGYDVTANRLVPVDTDDPTLADVYVAVPVSGHVAIAPDGTTDAQLDEVTDDMRREVTAWARALIAAGSVAGVAASAASYGPPGRPTHELVEDPSGRRVLRRIGFALF